MAVKKRHFVSIQFDVPLEGWKRWTGFVPDENGKCVVYPYQIYKKLTGNDMPAHTRILL